jgi:hypothetical protein
MGFFEDLGNAVSSGLAVVADVVETVVETVTDTAENAVDTAADTMQDAVNHVVDWIDIHAGPVVGGIAVVVGGVVNGIVEGVQQILTGVLHVAKDLGSIVGSLLRLDLPSLIGDVLHLLIDVGVLVVDVARFVTGGFVFGQIVEGFERNGLRRFVDHLLADTFSGAEIDAVRDVLRMDSAGWGLRCHVTHRTCVMDSDTMPLADMHRAGTLDLFAMAGVLSFDSFSIFQPRYTVKWLDASGRESLLPASRYHIAKFLEGGSPRLRVYAMNGSELRDSMHFATDHFGAMGIRLSWNHMMTVPQWTPLVVHAIEEPREFELVCLSADQDDLLGRYLEEEGLKRPEEGELRITSLETFKVLGERPPSDASTDFITFNGIVAGRAIREGNLLAGCATPGRTDRCCSLVRRTADRLGLGSGVAMRNVYPGYFSKMVMAHELGHYFGLCHFAHDGVQNIMFSLGGGNAVLDVGLLRYYLRSEPHFSFEDEKNVWRFVVHQLRGELTGSPSASAPRSAASVAPVGSGRG